MGFGTRQPTSNDPDDEMMDDFARRLNGMPTKDKPAQANPENSMTDNVRAAANTDRELWRETPDDYYSPSIHVTATGGIGINVGGTVVVMTAREWHRLASPPDAAGPDLGRLEKWLREQAVDAHEGARVSSKTGESADCVNDWLERERRFTAAADIIARRGRDAAREVERLRERVRRLEEAARPFAAWAALPDMKGYEMRPNVRIGYHDSSPTVGELRALAALVPAPEVTKP